MDSADIIMGGRNERNHQVDSWANDMRNGSCNGEKKKEQGIFPVVTVIDKHIIGST